MSVENQMKALLGEATAKADLSETVEAMKEYVALAEKFVRFHDELLKQSEDAVGALDKMVMGVGKKLMAKPLDKHYSVLASPWDGLEELQSEMSATIQTLEKQGSLDDAEKKVLDILYDASWVDESQAVTAYRQLFESLNQFEEAIATLRKAVGSKGSQARSLASLKQELQALENAAK